MNVQDELRRMANLTCGQSRSVLAVAADELDEQDREIARLKARVNDLAEIVRDFAASAEYAEAEGINTEPEA